MEKNEMIKAELKLREALVNKKKNDFVEAGAGAGKTYSLVTRIFHQLTRDGDQAEPKQIVAITFTNKAAEELRVRIVKRIKSVEEDPKEEDRLKERKAYLLKCIDEMQISTIHKFCDNILRENAIIAGLSPDYQIIVDEDEKKRKNATIRRYFRDFSGKDWGKYSYLENNKTVKSRICSCFESLTSNAVHLAEKDIYYYNDLKENIYALIASQNTAKDDFINAVYDFYEQYGNLLNEPTDKEGKTENYINTKYISLFNDFDVLTKEQFALSFEKNGFKVPFNGKKKAALLGLTGVDIIEKLNELLDPIELNETKIKIYYANLFLKDGYRLYTQYLKDIDSDINHLSNNDLIYQTNKLLKEHPDVVNKLQKKIKHLYIDEYQDTDSLQYEIAKLIAADREDCLYLVGDPKQSIYRFRGAEPDVFFNTKDTFINNKDKCDTYNLNINFRSNGMILDWVNKQYSKEGGNISLVSDSSYEYQEMLTALHNTIDESEVKEDRLLGFYNYGLCGPENIAELILDLVNNKKVRKVKKEYVDGKLTSTVSYEKVKYKDIMLLFEGVKKMPPFIEALTKVNIPTKISGSSDFSGTFALRAYVSLFEALNSNSQSVLTLAESVFQTIYPSKYIDKNDEECHEYTKQLLNSLKDKMKNMSSYGKAIYLIEHLEYILKEDTDAFAFEINNITSKLYQMVEEVFARSFNNGNELVAEFRKYLETPVERESSIEKDVDAISVINLHKAKGLEAPIVIWVCTSKKSNNKKTSMFFKSKFYEGELVDCVLKLDPSNSELNQIQEEEEFEKARLEYVAATRPGETFIFCKSAEYKAGLFNAGGRNYHLDELPKINIEEVSEEIVEEKKYEVVDYEPISYNYLAQTSKGVSVKSPSSLERTISPTRMKLKIEVGVETESDRPSSNVVGTILHRALELLIKDGDDFERATDIAINEKPDVEDDVNDLRLFIKACLKSYNTFYKEKELNKYNSYPELTFSYYNEKSNTVNNGSIDLLLEKDGEYIIIDYKSDEAEYIKDDGIFEKTLLEKYQPQLNMYEKVVKDLFGNEIIIKKVIIYFRRYQKDEGKIETLAYTL